MISKNQIRHTLISAGATQVSDAALIDFEAWLTTFMKQDSAKAVGRMQAEGRTRIEVRDIGE